MRDKEQTTQVAAVRRISLDVWAVLLALALAALVRLGWFPGISW
jgi:hypothetical protein